MLTMAPLELQPHSCAYCQNIVVNLNGSEGRRDDRDMATRGVLFDCTFKDIKSGAELGCQFCKWFMDDEFISRETAIRHSPNDLPTNDPYRKYWMHCRIPQYGFRISWETLSLIIRSET